MRIFISYRRDDRKDLAAAIAYRLKTKFGESLVFIDKGIDGGQDWEDALKKELNKCDVLLIIIGEKWEAILKERSRESNDWVRKEIEEGLEQKKFILPVLIDGVKINETELPESIKKFAKRQAIELRSTSSLDTDLDHLVKVLNKHKSNIFRKRLILFALVILVPLIIIVIGYLLNSQSPSTISNITNSPVFTESSTSEAFLSETVATETASPQIIASETPVVFATNTISLLLPSTVVPTQTPVSNIPVYPVITTANATQVSQVATLTVDSTVRTIAFNNEGNTVAAGTSGNRLYIWNIETILNGASITPTPTPFPGGWVNSVTFSPDGASLAFGIGDDEALGNLFLHDLNNEQNISLVDGTISQVTVVSFSPDGTRLAYATNDDDDDGVIHILDASNNYREIASSPPLIDSQAIRDLSFNHDGTMLVFGSESSDVCVWDMRMTSALDCSYDFPRTVYTVAFSPDSSLIAAGGNGGIVRIWDLSVDTEDHIDEYTYPQVIIIRRIAFSPDGTLLAIGIANGDICLYSIESETCVHQWRAHTHEVRSLAFSPDGTLLLSGGGENDPTIRVWAVREN